MPLGARLQLLTKRYQIHKRRLTVKNERKETDKKTGTLRPWLVDVSIEHLR
jgi:hypothetical protein